MTPSPDAPPSPAALSPQTEDVLRWFVEVMRAKLLANEHKGGWQNDRVSDLLRRLHEETGELAEAISLLALIEEIVGEAADVANFAMMIADRVKHGGIRPEDRAACGVTPEASAPSIPHAIRQALHAVARERAKAAIGYSDAGALLLEAPAGGGVVVCPRDAPRASSNFIVDALTNVLLGAMQAAYAIDRGEPGAAVEAMRKERDAARAEAAQAREAGAQEAMGVALARFGATSGKWTSTEAYLSALEGLVQGIERAAEARGRSKAVARIQAHEQAKSEAMNRADEAERQANAALERAKEAHTVACAEWRGVSNLLDDLSILDGG